MKLHVVGAIEFLSKVSIESHALRLWLDQVHTSGLKVRFKKQK